MQIKVKFLSVFANKIGTTEEIIELFEDYKISKLIKIITKKYKDGLSDYISVCGDDYAFNQLIKIGIQIGGEGRVQMIDYMDGPDTILNNGDIVFIYYALSGG